MKYLFCLILLVPHNVNLFAQNLNIKRNKPPIDTSVFSNWPSIESGAINNDGNYILYSINNVPIRSNTLVVKSTKSIWKLEMPGAVNGLFSDNGRFVLFQKQDSIGIFQLGTDKLEWLSNIKSYHILGKGEKQSIVFLENNNNKKLSIKNLFTDKTQEVDSVCDYLPCSDGQMILITTVSRDSTGLVKRLSKLSIIDTLVIPIWASNDSNAQIKLSSAIIDNRRGQIAFLISYKDKNVIWYYSRESHQSKILTEASSFGLKNNLEIEQIYAKGFSKDGDWLFFQYKSNNFLSLDKKLLNVDIWNYKDFKLQSQQLYEVGPLNSVEYQQHYVAVINLKDYKIFRLTYDNESLVINNNKDDLVLVSNYGSGNSTERNWNSTSRTSTFLSSVKTGQRKALDFEFADFSPATGKYVAGLNVSRRSYLVYDLLSKTSHNCSEAFPIECRLDEDNDNAGPNYSGLSIAGWMTNDSSIIMYDKYDIWKVDPLGRKKAINITKRYGRMHRIILRLIGVDNGTTPIEFSSTYILSGFNEITKESGFLSFCMKENNIPKLLCMSPCYYEGPYLQKIKWLQLKDSAIFLVRRESVSQSPNLFITHDFKHFTPISSLYPEANYNWINSELITWQTFDKKRISGVLYKPEDFNPGKKYPVIINYYERLSKNAYKYKEPAFAADNINIPWFVSRGYIVFQPDIFYKVGHPGKSIYDCVVSGTRFIMKYKWLDIQKMGIQGHSWGGYETNYIITHSHLYAAALSASSVSDYLSDYGSIMKNGVGKQFFYELDQCRMGCTPWQKPELYIEHSPILLAYNVKTPLLMMNNINDEVVPFSQGVEFFTALRRLKKKVWMLQYDGEGHSVGGRAGVDYTTRMTQFFDYYLKGALAPKWMTIGVPAALKAVDSGLQLDTSGVEP